ncbi:MAG TPA: hypothetical protein VGF75_02830, partial [Candidatus Saccharimonadales bacterium]
ISSNLWDNSNGGGTVYTLTGPGSSVGTFDMSSTQGNGPGLVLYNSANTVPSFQTYNFNATNSYVYFRESAAVTIPVIASGYGNLWIDNNTNLTFGAAGNLLIKGTLNVNANTFDDKGYTISVNGNLQLSSQSYNSFCKSSVAGGNILLTGGSVQHNITNNTTNNNVDNLTLNDPLGANVANSFVINKALNLVQGNLQLSSVDFYLSGTIGNNGGFLYCNNSSSNIHLQSATTPFGTLNFATGGQTLNYLELNNSIATVINLGSNLTINANGRGLYMSNKGLLVLGNNNLTLGSTAYIDQGGNTNLMVVADATSGATGQLMKTYPTTPYSMWFPIGDMSGTTEYSPIYITNFNSTISRTIGVNVNNTHNSNDASVNNYLNRFWNFTDNQAGNGSYTYQVDFYPVTADIQTTSSNYGNINMNWWSGSAWNPVTTARPGSSGSPDYQIAGMTQTTAPLGNTSGAVQYAGLVSSSSGAYVWQPTSGSADWTVPTNWSPARNFPYATDILKFTNGGTTVAYNVPTQTIAQLLVDNTNIGANGNTNVTLQAASGGGNTLTNNGNTATTNLSVAANATLQ